MGINLASYVGATQVRRMVLGDENRAPNAAELARMQALVRDAMREGAMGLSTSLQYAPAPVREDGGVDRAGVRSGEGRRHLRIAHPR